jgi:hypothetical protein
LVGYRCRAGHLLLLVARLPPEGGSHETNLSPSA